MDKVYIIVDLSHLCYHKMYRWPKHGICDIFLMTEPTAAPASASLQCTNFTVTLSTVKPPIAKLYARHSSSRISFNISSGCITIHFLFLFLLISYIWMIMNESENINSYIHSAQFSTPFRDGLTCTDIESFVKNQWP